MARAELEIRLMPGIIAFSGYDPRTMPASLAERLVLVSGGQRTVAKALGDRAWGGSDYVGEMGAGGGAAG